MSYSTYVSYSETCGRCESNPAAKQVLGVGVWELWRDCYLCDECIDSLSIQQQAWWKWIKKRRGTGAQK